MKSNRRFKNIGSAALTLALAIGISLMATMPANAQFPTNRPYPDDRVRWTTDRLRQYAFLLGYHNAYTEGREAAEEGRRISVRNMQGYRDPINGWLAWMGSQDIYRSNYRRGYEQGFNDGQSRRARRHGRADVERVLGASLKSVYNQDDDDWWSDDRWRRGRGNGRWNDRNDGRFDRNEIFRIAQQNGYREGYREGQSDRARRRSFNYNDSFIYRNAISGFRTEYRDRSIYQQGFRDGFRRGYEDAYRGRGNNVGQRWPLPWPS
ncbi:MAG TPA: hypothetical protein VG778_05455 [Blastocatellia bacterium]|jgi:hypothetical protein|nr:hypothetical protein [Blastocatellia bacterium]